MAFCHSRISVTHDLCYDLQRYASASQRRPVVVSQYVKANRRIDTGALARFAYSSLLVISRPGFTIDLGKDEIASRGPHERVAEE